MHRGLPMKVAERMRLSGFALAALLAASTAFMPQSAFALDLYAFSALTASTETASPLYVDVRAGLEHQAGDFGIAWELGFDSAGTYQAPFFGSYFGGVSVEIRKAGFSYSQGGFTVGLGQTPLEDVIFSPYSLFQNSLGHPMLGAEITYEADGFFYRDRWMILNKDLQDGLYTSDNPDGYASVYDDRGAVLKTYGVKTGNFRFGYQDSVIFTGDYFDIDYFANPIPTIFVQQIARAPGRPWTREDGDHNAIMGFFADWNDGGRYAYAQILVDDFNMNRFIDPSGKQNPDKIAWSLGGRMESPAGTFGLYHAGATKYTFSSAREMYYSYTLYPGSLVLWEDTETPIGIEENMLGYLHGENNIALLGTWKRGFGDYDLAASLEMTLSGSKSPANPWHEYDTLEEAGEGTKLLDDPVLEKKVVLGFEAGRPFGDFYVGIAGKLGFVVNRLETVAAAASPDGNAEPYFAPSDESGFIGEFSLFGRYVLRP